MGRVGIARTSWGELDRAEAAGPSWTELLRRAKVSYGEPERAGATQLKKGRAGLTQSNREEGELGVTSGRLSLIHKPSVGIALQGNSRHTAPGGRYVNAHVDGRRLEVGRLTQAAPVRALPTSALEIRFFLFLN